MKEVGAAYVGVGKRWIICPDVTDFLCAVFQEVLLYRSETWVMSTRIGTTLVGFHHRAAHRLTGHQPRKVLYFMCVYPPLAKVVDEASLYDVSRSSSR